MAGSYEMRIDRDKNRHYIRISGFFRGRDVDPAMTDLEVALRDVRPGFDTITDLSDSVPGAPGASAALAKGGEMIKAVGRRRGDRISGGLMTGLMQYQRLLRGVFEEESVRYAKSVDEAHEILDDWPADGGG